jgi:DNA-binding NarL/FixJ family response regulator
VSTYKGLETSVQCGESLANLLLLRWAELDAKWIGDKGMLSLDEIKVTPRDEEVLHLLVQGCSNKEIAQQLRISPRTVKQHLRTLFLRAGIKDGRKRVKLATAMFQKERREVCTPAIG